MFELRHVSFGYPGKSDLLQHLDLFIGEGEFVLLQGPSGSGKSTFLRLLNRLAVPRQGEILFKGRPLESYDPTLLRRRVAYLQQVPVMLDDTVRENLLLPFRFRTADQTSPPGDKVLQEHLEAFLLNDVSLEDNSQNLSVGQKQRLALIRALLLNLEVLLLDEPPLPWTLNRGPSWKTGPKRSTASRGWGS